MSNLMKLIKQYNIRNENELNEVLRRRRKMKGQNIHVYHHSNTDRVHKTPANEYQRVANKGSKHSINLRFKTTAPKVNLKRYKVHSNGTGNFVFSLKKPQLHIKGKSTHNGVFLRKSDYKHRAASKNTNIRNVKELLKISNINKNVQTQAINNLKTNNY